MIGAELVCETVADYLRDNVDARVLDVEERAGDRDANGDWDVAGPSAVPEEVGAVGTFETIAAEHRVRIDEGFPAALVMPREDRLVRSLGMADDGSGEEWEVAYLLRVVLLIEGREYDDTARKARRATLAVRELVLEAGAFDRIEADWRTIPATLRSTYAGVAPIESRWRTAIHIDFELRTLEVATGLTTSLGEVESASAGGVGYGPTHPAFE